jgi:hypothetical protein
MATAAAMASVQTEKPDTRLRPGRVKSDALRKWALARANTLPRKAGSDVLFWDLNRWWPEDIPNPMCPDCGSSERVTRDGWSDSLRAVTSVFTTSWLLASRHKYKSCPASIGKIFLMKKTKLASTSELLQNLLEVFLLSSNVHCDHALPHKMVGLMRPDAIIVEVTSMPLLTLCNGRQALTEMY